MLPENHFLSLAVKEAMKPYKDWEASVYDDFAPDYFDDNTSAKAIPSKAHDSGPAPVSESMPDLPLHNLRISSSSDGSNSPEKDDASVEIEESFGTLLAQYHFHLSILSKDDSYIRLPTASNLHTYPLLGSGHSFIVRRASKKENEYLEGLAGAFFAIKSLNINAQTDPSSRMREILQEVRILTHEPLRNHPNVIKLHGFGWERMRGSIDSKITRWPFLVTEHAELGSAVQFFEEHIVSISSRIKICLDVGLGLQALHAADVVHGDVKLENVLIFRDTENRPRAKITDFGFAAVDLDGSKPSLRFSRGTDPWKAPEVRGNGMIAWKDLSLTDVFSYGMLVWRTVCFGHRPFVEAEGGVDDDNMKWIEAAKSAEGIMIEIATESVRRILGREEDTRSHCRVVCEMLEYCLPVRPSERNFKAALDSIGGTLRGVPKPEPLRIKTISVSHGLGIYKFDIFDNRLQTQMIHALHSFCNSPISRKPPLDVFLSHCASTLSNWYCDRWSNGQTTDETRTSIRSLAWRYVTMSALAGSDANAESLYTMNHLLWEREFSEEIDLQRSAFPKLAGRALRDGMEFILREVMENNVPGKAEFMQMFTTRLCRGANLNVGPVDPNVPLQAEAQLLRYIATGSLTPDGMFRMLVTWGLFESAKNLYAKGCINANSVDPFGETALLRTFRAGHFELAKWLLTTARADPRVASKLKITPLHWLHVFSGEECSTLAQLMVRSGADPNAVAVDNGTSSIEASFQFFKGPPLIRAVAAGNEDAVSALLANGADPTVPIYSGGEDAIVFATRRLRASILSMLLLKASNYPVLDWGIGRRSLLARVLECNIVYAAKVHGKRHEQARKETFNLLWNWEATHALPKLKRISKLSKGPDWARAFGYKKNTAFIPARIQETTSETGSPFFRSVAPTGRIPIQAAVENGDFISVKHILELAATEGNEMKQQMANIGLQSAIHYDKLAMVHYFLTLGADPLAPKYSIEYHKKYQNEPLPKSYYTFISSNTNGRGIMLHSLADAGSSAAMMGKLCVLRVRPAFIDRLSKAQLDARRMVAIELSYDHELPGEDGDELLDRRNESSETAFFLALQKEEYELASFLRYAGASKNILIYDKPGGTPIVEQLLTWSPTAARTALEFLATKTWGNLLLSRHPRRHYLDLCIAASASWPSSQASGFISDVYGYMSPRHDHEVGVSNGYTVVRRDGEPMACGCRIDWDAHIVKAIEALHVSAVEKLVMERHSTEPVKDAFSRINALRRVLFGIDIPTTAGGRHARYAAWEKIRAMTPTLHRRVHHHRYDISILLRNLADRIMVNIADELEICNRRLLAGAVSVLGYIRRLKLVLEPFLAVAAGCQDVEIERLQSSLNERFPDRAGIAVRITRRAVAWEGLDIGIECENEDLRMPWDLRRFGIEEGGVWRF